MSKRLTESQIVAILKEAEGGIPVPELCRSHGIGRVPFINGDLNMAEWKPLMFVA